MSNFWNVLVHQLGVNPQLLENNPNLSLPGTPSSFTRLLLKTTQIQDKFTEFSHREKVLVTHLVGHVYDRSHAPHGDWILSFHSRVQCDQLILT